MFLHLLTVGIDLIFVFALLAAIFFIPVVALAGFGLGLAVLYLHLGLLNRRVLRDRPDMRLSRAQIAQYPIYRLLLQIFRVAGGLECLVHYLPLVRKPERITVRERLRGDIPPCPDTLEPDWSSVYLPQPHPIRMPARRVTERPGPSPAWALSEFSGR